MKYLKLFNTHAEYETFTATTEFIKPNVSHCKEEVEVHYNPYDYRDRYLTFIAREQGTFKLTIGSAVTTSILESISYSTDGGETWTTTNNENDATVTITTPIVNQGDRVLWKGTGVGVSTTTDNNDRPSTSSIFSSTGELDVEGNIMSLIYGDDFVDKDYVVEGSSYNFALLFYANTAHTGGDYAKVVSAKKMCMPIKNVPTACYLRMFQESYTAGTIQSNNTLVETPRCIAADSVGISACTCMFLGSTSLTTVPSGLLPATELDESCYRAMFQNTSLTVIPNDLLPATILAEGCYRGMFFGCSNLTAIPDGLLPSTTLAKGCYYTMFCGCTSINSIPDDLLPATIMAVSAYTYMLEEVACETVPKNLLPATILADSCYYGMFNKCASLRNAPELPATTLADSCYYQMFYGCTSLTACPTSIGDSSTTMPASACTCMFQDCTSLVTAPELPATTLSESCYYQMFTGCVSLAITPELPATNLSGARGCYIRMFRRCTNLTTAPELPATTLSQYCYYQMFYGCASLTTAPEILPATTLQSHCYRDLFQGCTSLTTAPELPATALATNCYSSMFGGCSSLNYIKAMFTTTPSTTYTSNWVSGVAASGTFVKNSAAEWDVTGVNGIPAGWTVETASA